MNNDLLYQIALMQVKGIGITTAKQLETHFGSAKMVFSSPANELSQAGGVSEQLYHSLRDKSVLVRAEQELDFIQKHGITALHHRSENYPSLLRTCADAPFILFYKGKLSALRKPSVAVIGTRKATHYGRELCDKFAAELAALAPNVNVLSGLAYGIDIAIHKASLDSKLATVGVLAHGLDRIYPEQHRQTAIAMLEQGGLLTEFLSGTRPDKQNFVLRNRIVAGMASATIVVESASSGGALITAGMASRYKRRLFAFPGRVDDSQSEGCLALLKNKQAELITSAADLIERMEWAPALHAPDVQPKLFPELTKEETQVVNLLAISPARMDEMAVTMDLPVHKLSALLFEMELKGLIRAYPGGVYKRMV
ncbi:MAG: DNA-processing protein DprA [Bacteroidales bacterium]